MTQNPSAETNDEAVISPGATIGILGNGQLGRMMAISAKQMGYRIHVFAPAPDSPGGQASDLEVIGDLNDLDAIEAFAKSVDVLTVETENIPVATFDAAAKHVPAFPGRRTLEVAQNRAREKQFFKDHDIPTNQFEVIRSLEELKTACESILPGVLKTTTGGYDGKGQVVIRSKDEVENAWSLLNTDEAILESWVEYEFEFSIIGVRNSQGMCAAYPAIRNDHRNQVLDVSISPSGLSDEVNATATKHVFEILEKLETVGVLTVEFFYSGGNVVVNEIAPRPHNSGHLTIEGHVTNQFEQHVRAVCGLKLGSTQILTSAAMANLLGDEWSGGEPKWHLALAVPSTKLHLYGKVDPKPGRKMGHLTSIAGSVEEARENVLKARDALTSSNSAADQADKSLAQT